jgi:hypothetical protein
MKLYYIIQGSTNTVMYRIIAVSPEAAYNSFREALPNSEIGAYVVALSTDTFIKQ